MLSILPTEEVLVHSGVLSSSMEMCSDICAPFSFIGNFTVSNSICPLPFWAAPVPIKTLSLLHLNNYYNYISIVLLLCGSTRGWGRVRRATIAEMESLLSLTFTSFGDNYK